MEVFLSLDKRLGPFSIDLFAFRTNTQLLLYCSWRPDPIALAVDALSISWGNHRPYMFPPFALIPHCLAKLHKEGISALIIAPVWPNQIWFPQLLNSLVDTPNPLATNPRYCDQPHRSESPISNPGPSPTSHMISFRRSIHAGGLSERDMDLLQKSWRQSTESAYSSAGRQWDSWCIG